MSQLIETHVLENLKKSVAKTERFKNRNRKIIEFKKEDKVPKQYFRFIKNIIENLLFVPGTCESPKSKRKAWNTNLFGLRATISKVITKNNRKFYQLKWITRGLDNENPNELSKKYYLSSQLKKVCFIPILLLIGLQF
jgi:hypothetical protein